MRGGRLLLLQLRMEARANSLIDSHFGGFISAWPSTNYSLVSLSLFIVFFYLISRFQSLQKRRSTYVLAMIHNHFLHRQKSHRHESPANWNIFLSLTHTHAGCGRYRYISCGSYSPNPTHTSYCVGGTRLKLPPTQIINTEFTVRRLSCYFIFSVSAWTGTECSQNQSLVLDPLISVWIGEFKKMATF